MKNYHVFFFFVFFWPYCPALLWTLFWWSVMCFNTFRTLDFYIYKLYLYTYYIYWQYIYGKTVQGFEMAIYQSHVQMQWSSNTFSLSFYSYVQTGCMSLKLILKRFWPLISDTLTAPPSVGVDITREERLVPNKHPCCVVCVFIFFK